MKEDTRPFSRFANEDAPLLSNLVIEDGNGATSLGKCATVVSERYCCSVSQLRVYYKQVSALINTF